jgi:NitT/TauT family transport system substrate-binding protein
VEALVAASSGQDLKVQLDQWERVKELMSDDFARDVALGGFDPKRMEADYALIATYFSLAKPFEVKAAYTNEFLDRNVRMPK